MHSRDGLPARAASFHYQAKCLPPKQDRSIKRGNRVMTGPKLSSLDQQQSKVQMKKEEDLVQVVTCVTLIPLCNAIAYKRK